MSSSGRGRAPSGAVRTIGARGGSILATFLLSAGAARFLGPELAGAFFLIYAIVALFATAGRLGADNLALRLMGGDSRNPRTDIVRLLGLASVGGTAAFIVGAIMIHLVVGDRIGLGMAIIVATCILAQAMAVVAGTVMRGMGMLASGVFAELGSLPAVATVIIVSVGLVAPENVTLSTALVAMTIAAWATMAWSVPLALGMARTKLRDQEEAPSRVGQFLRIHRKRLASMMGTSVLAYGMVWAPVFVLSLGDDLTQVSYYSVAIRLANIVGLLPTIQISYLAPEFARRFYANNLAGLNALAGRSAFQVGAITAAPLVILVAFAAPIMTLVFGAEFAPAAPIMVILSVGVFLVMLLGQVNQLMLLCGLEGTALVLSFSGLAIWATIGTWLTMQTGAVGTAWLGAAVSVSYAATAAFALKRKRGIESYVRIPSRRR